MSVTPNGPAAVALAAIVSLLANVPAFQAWTGTADATHAQSHIFTGETGHAVRMLAVTAGVLTITLYEPADSVLAPGQTVTLEGSGVGAQGLALDGAYTVSTVAGAIITAATAADTIDATPVKEAFLLPCALPIAIVTDADAQLEAQIVGALGPAIYRSSADIVLEAQTTALYANDPVNALAEARTAAGQILQGLAETQETNDLCSLSRLEMVRPAVFVDLDEQEDNTQRFVRWRALLRVSWGLEG